mmetsp:Transcript_115609/g.274764  ORF Transcript_115609/g.274764 Transcript_115609/m.274764 type:complete len:117 (+) Transcript_115609:70-420(+)
MLREERSRLWPPSESPAKGEATSSLQRPHNKEVISREFNLRMGGWFPAMKWLIKEFRLRIGYETPDEEAGIRFWRAPCCRSTFRARILSVADRRRTSAASDKGGGASSSRLDARAG